MFHLLLASSRCCWEVWGRAGIPFTPLILPPCWKGDARYDTSSAFVCSNRSMAAVGWGGEQLADQAGERRETEVKEPKARDRRQETETAGETKGQRRK